ncbi:hypothetical protein ACTPC6_03895 [Clostridioides difficile]
MKLLVPISNLYVKDVIKLGDMWLIPNKFYDIDKINFDSKLSKEEIQEINRTMNMAKVEYFECDFNNYALIIYLSEEKFEVDSVIDEIEFLECVCNLIVKQLNYLVLSYCSINKPYKNPGIPGIIGDFRTGIVIEQSSKICRRVLGKVYNIFYDYKNECMLDRRDSEKYIDLENYRDVEEIYKIIFSCRNDEVYLNCREALSRVCESMYMNDLNMSFVYLVCTLDMLNTNSYQNKHITSNLLPFISNNKNDYFKTSKNLKLILTEIRGPIFHKGKSIYDIIKNENEIYTILDFMLNCIVNYCLTVFKTGCEDFHRLNKERERRQKLLKLK